MATEDDAFRADLHLHLTAALVGIHRDRWVSIPEHEADPQRALEVMARNRFDVLPIVAGDVVTKFFCTESWNDYSKVIRETIVPSMILPFDTPLRDVLRLFADRGTHFFFLSGARDVVGLISLVNLNCRPARVYLYNLLAELEMRLASFIFVNVRESDLLKMQLDGQSANEFEQAKHSHAADRAKGLEAPFVEYLNLWHLYKIILKVKLYSTLGYSRDDFKRFREVNELRKRVMHPTRSLIARLSDGPWLARSVECMDDLTSRLDEAAQGAAQ